MQMNMNNCSRFLFGLLLGQTFVFLNTSCGQGGKEKTSSYNVQHFGSLDEIRSIDSLKSLSLQLNRKIEEKTKKLERLKEEVAKLSDKQISNSFVALSMTSVKSEFAYLKKYPSEIDFDKTKFIVEGDEVLLVRIKENHGYVEYVDPITESTLKGWVDLHDLEPNANAEDDN
ncbi:MAG: hypothetical protein RIQ90_213 [Bacteroidota bacterium]